MNAMSPHAFPAAADISLAEPLPIVVKVSSRAARAEDVEAAGHAFGDCMEMAMTGLVVTGVLLFGAGLLRLGVAPCLLRSIGVDGLTILAGVTGLAMLAALVRGVGHLGRMRRLRRG
jgi:hypothetical protein